MVQQRRSWRKTNNGYKVLYWASQNCGIEVVETILDKNVNIDGLSAVSIVVENCYYAMVIN
jgi:hypothetical protein